MMIVKIVNGGFDRVFSRSKIELSNKITKPVNAPKFQIILYVKKRYRRRQRGRELEGQKMSC